MWIVGRRRGTRPELRSDDESLMRLRIERHSARSLLSRDIFGHAELVRGILFDYREDSIASARRKGESPLRVEGGCVHAIADRRRGQHFPAVGVDHGHHLVVAAREQAAVLAIDSKPTRLGTWRQRPLR